MELKYRALSFTQADATIEKTTIFFYKKEIKEGIRKMKRPPMFLERKD